MGGRLCCCCCRKVAPEPPAPLPNLFLEGLGIPLLGRPTAAEVKALWEQYDTNRNDYLGRVVQMRFFAEMAVRWGGGQQPVGWEGVVLAQLGDG